MVTIDPKSLLLASAQQASVALEAILRAANEISEIDEAAAVFHEEETLEKLLDAAKLLIEAVGDQDRGEQAPVYTTIAGFLEGWGR